MVRPVAEDARGIVRPDLARGRFALDRFPPGPATARFVDRCWVVSWDLGTDEHTQEVLAHPVVNVSVGDEGMEVHGVARQRQARHLTGTGRAVAAMFRPGGFSPLVDGSVADLTDRVVPAAEVLGPAASDVAAAVQAEPDAARAAALLDAWLGSLLLAGDHPCEPVVAVAERIAADRTIRRAAQVAELLGVGVRQAQRAFATHVGVGPTWVVRRYRLYDALEAAGTGEDVDWAALAVDLGYADQAHLVRDVSEAVGVPPARYARAVAAGAVGVDG